MHACIRRRRTQLDIFWRFQVMEWFLRNNCAIACDTRAQFWWGGAQRINKQNGVGNYLHGRWINSNFLSLFSGEPLAATFFSYARQPEVNFLHTWAVIWNKFEGMIVSLRVKTLSSTNLVVPRRIKKKKAYFWLTSVATWTSYWLRMWGLWIMVITRVRLLFSLIGVRDTEAWFLNKKLREI